MGLDDLVPDGVDTSGGGQGRSKPEPEDDPEKVVIGKEPNRKIFDEEKWERVKKIIINEMGLQPRKVVNNYSPEERYEIIHEAALLDEKKIAEEEMEHRSKKRCLYCGNAVNEDAHEVIEEEIFCSHHTAAQVRRILDEQ